MLDEAARLRHLKSRPSREGLSAVAAALGARLRVGRVARIGGGLGSATSAVDLQAPTGRIHRVVLKRYMPGSDIPRLEWLGLTAAAKAEVPSPDPLALDLDGEWFGAPALVLSRLPGRPYLRPRDPLAWTRQIASTLAAIESTKVPRRPPELHRPHASDVWTTPEDANWGPLYERAASAIAGLLPKTSSRRVLCHADFHPGNMLFERGRLSGVVDWSSTKAGPRAFDLSYCRTEVALLLGGNAAQHLRDSYEQIAGFTTTDTPLWDLMCALGARRWSHTWLLAYGEQGRRDLTLQQFRARLRAFTARALAEVGK